MSKMEDPICQSQRFVRPLDVPPGFWKRQLPGRILELAASGDLRALERVLDEHPDWLNRRGPHNRTFLWEAVRRGRFETARWLVERGAEIDATGAYNRESFVQLTPYCAAIYYRKPELADFLRSKGARLDLFRAAYMGDAHAVAAELDAHPERLNAEDPYDAIYFLPVLAFAVAAAQTAVITLLLDRGALVVPYSALLIFLAGRRASGSEIDQIELLLAHGARIDCVDSSLFGIISDTRLYPYLIERGVPVNRKGNNGFPPLVYVARGDKGEHPDKALALLEAGADVNAPGPGGRTALHYASAAGHTRMISLLLAHGAHPNLRDEDGRLALPVTSMD